MSARRSPAEIAADYRARAAEQETLHQRRLSVASDSACSLMYGVEKAARALAAHMGQEGAPYIHVAEALRSDRESRWARIRKDAAQ